MPKDSDTAGLRYPEEGEFLPKNPATDPEYIRKQEERARLMLSVKDLRDAKKNKNKDADGGGKKNKKKKAKKVDDD